ncbi:MAG: nitroreductase family protein [Euryarchaeota archaeon]|nr:nitroreductase family protein [Euryarchaeota archaeon]
MGANAAYEPLIGIMQQRRSVRRYTREPVSDGLLQRLLEAAQTAPSAGNLQARDFIVVRDPNMKHELAEAAYGQFFISMAPIVLVGCANIARSRTVYGQRAELYAVQDVTIAAAYLQLAAEAAGVATCWIGAFDEQRVIRALSVPTDVRAVLMLPIGYPDERPSATPRMNRSQFTHNERWGSPLT